MDVIGSWAACAKLRVRESSILRLVCVEGGLDVFTKRRGKAEDSPDSQRGLVDYRGDGPAHH